MQIYILKTVAKCISFIMVFSLLSACVHLNKHQTPSAKSEPEKNQNNSKDKPKSKAKKKWMSVPDISGIAPMGADTYLVVHDAKAHKVDKPRIGIVKINRETEKLKYKALAFSNGPDPITSDLEAICRLPDRPKEFLIMESGYWEGKYGRIFHIEIADKMVNLIHSEQLPDIEDDFEGMACAEKSDGTVFVILGQRGGEKTSADISARKGALRFANYNPISHAFTTPGTPVLIHAPNIWRDNALREITGLSLGADGTLWASAAIDLDQDLGPFRSLVYGLGKIYPNAQNPFIASTTHKVWVMDGMKIEAVTSGFDGKSPSYGSEDEKLGGIWRELPKTPSLTLPVSQPTN